MLIMIKKQKQQWIDIQNLKTFMINLLKILHFLNFKYNYQSFQNVQYLEKLIKIKNASFKDKLNLKHILMNFLVLTKFWVCHQYNNICLLKLLKINSKSYIFMLRMKISIAIESYTYYDDVVVYSMRFKNKITKEEWIYK